MTNTPEGGSRREYVENLEQWARRQVLGRDPGADPKWAMVRHHAEALVFLTSDPHPEDPEWVEIVRRRVQWILQEMGDG